MTGNVPRRRVCAVSDLRHEEIRRIDIPGRLPIAVYRLGDAFFATDDTCTHGAASLADGFIEGDQVECPFHSGRFDIRTGQPTLYPCTEALRTYAVDIDGDAVFVDLARPAQDPVQGGKE